MTARATGIVLAGIAVTVAAAVAVATATPVPPWALIAGVAVLVAGGVLVIARGWDGVGCGLLVLAVVTSPWNAIGLGSLKPGPLLLAASLLVLGTRAIACRRRVHLPWWIWPLTTGIVVIAGVTVLAPPSPSYLASRFSADPTLSLSQLEHVGWVSALDASQWLVALVGLPLAAWLAVQERPGLPPVLADAWVLGAAASALVGLTDQIGWTAISAQLLPVVDVGGRQAGLSVQPNHLAVAAVLALPVAVWRVGSGRHRLLGLLAIAVLLGGVAVSQSRGGLVVSAAAVAVVLLGDRRSRRRLAPLVAVLVAGAVVVLALMPSTAQTAGSALRLTGQDSAAVSDTVRDRIAAQTVEDIGSSPWHGIGFEVAVAGHDVWLQLLACGGVVLLLAFIGSLAGFVVDAWSLRDRFDGLTGILGVCVGAWLVAGIVENNLTDLFLYVPYALVAAIPAGDAPRTAVGAAVLITGGTRP